MKKVDLFFFFTSEEYMILHHVQDLSNQPWASTLSSSTPSSCYGPFWSMARVQGFVFLWLKDNIFEYLTHKNSEFLNIFSYTYEWDKIPSISA